MMAFENNQVLQKIKQSDLRASKEILDIYQKENFNGFEEKQASFELFDDRKLGQNMLNISPSRNYLLNMDLMDKDSYEYSKNSTILTKSTLF